MGNAIRKPDQVFDVRLVERYRAKGLFTEKEYKKFLSELPDNEENAQHITAKDVLREPEQETTKRE